MRNLHSWPIFPSHLDPPIARSLSMQFILQELIHSFQLFQHLQQNIPEKLQGANLKEEIGVVIREMETFSLNKLCFYCEILLQASRIEENEPVLILEEMKHQILKTRLKMTTWKKMLVPLDQILTLLFELYADLKQKLCSFFHSLTPFFKEARSDENVLMYFIENKQILNSFLGPHKIENKLQSFFPSGFDQLRSTIIEGYTRRGFLSFLSQIDPLIDAMEWETPCPTP